MKKILNQIESKLNKAKIDNPRLEAEIILSFLLKIDRVKLLSNLNKLILKDLGKQIEKILARRCEHEPIAYILGFQPFMDFDVIVNKHTLIPRPETEFMVEETIKILNPKTQIPRPKSQKELKILDLCTGSGCIAIALARAFPKAKIIATDISTEALKVAKKNAQLQNIKNQIEFAQGNLFNIKKKTLDSGLGNLDLIISNPPYIASKELKLLEKDVKDYEPMKALNGGKDGLGFIRQIIAEGPKYLKKNGKIVFECDYNQAPTIKRLAPKARFIRDFNGIDRVVVI